MHAQLANSFQLLRTGDLTVYNSVAMICARVFLKRLPDRVQDLVEAGIPDRMNGNLHTVFVCVCDHPVHVFVRKEIEAPYIPGSPIWL